MSASNEVLPNRTNGIRHRVVLSVAALEVLLNRDQPGGLVIEELLGAGIPSDLGDAAVGVSRVAGGAPISQPVVLREIVMSYWEIWDVDAGNLVATRSTEREAQALVADLIGANGRGYLNALAVGETLSDGTDGQTLEGNTLAAWLERARDGERLAS